jgi:hypothetical protein
VGVACEVHIEDARAEANVPDDAGHAGIEDGADERMRLSVEMDGSRRLVIIVSASCRGDVLIFTLPIAS